MAPLQAGPYLFDTSAEGWVARSNDPVVSLWFSEYLALHKVSVSAVTITERIRGYSLLWQRSEPEARARIDRARVAYLSQPSEVVPVDAAVAVVAGEIMALLPEAPTPPRRSHRLAESRQERLARWRFDVIIAATALVAGMPLLHNNAVDFEAIRSTIERQPARFPRLGSLQLVRCSLLAELRA